METIDQRVMRVVAEQFGRAVAHISMETHRVTDLGSDSLDDVEAVMAIEDEFGIEIADEDLMVVNTVGEMVAVVKRYVL